MSRIQFPPQNQTFNQYLQGRYGPQCVRNFKKLENLYKKLSSSHSSLTFLCRCRGNKIIPKGFILKMPYDSQQCKRIIERAGHAMVRERIQFHRKNKVNLEYSINNLEQLMKQDMIQNDFNYMSYCIQNSYNSFNRNKNKIHKEKFTKLLQKKQEQYLNNTRNTKTFAERTVINLSSRTLDTHEKLVLAKGLNFAVTPKVIPTLEMVTAIEATAQRLPPEIAGDYRSDCKNALTKPYHSRSNLNTYEKSAITSLRSDDTIKILPADKGNATVVMNTEDYEHKLTQMISNTTHKILNEDNTFSVKNVYKKLNGNPTSSIERKIYRTLAKYKDILTKAERTNLVSYHSKPPHFYGLPKIHKPTHPLRPIVSSIGSPCQKLARYLLKILKPISGNTNSFVKNTPHFLEKLNELQINDTDILVSFDVESLFTNVPIEKTLEIVKIKLERDVSLNTRTKLNVNSIIELLKLCSEKTYFQFKNEFYQQEFGMAMGSPLSPILSNIFMEHFEECFVETYQNGPRVWWRYVDDVFAVWNQSRDDLNGFLDYINKQEPTITFTLETEKDDQLPFLDVLIKKSTSRVNTTVYRKKTHTNRYLHYNSNHHTSVKKGIVKCLYNRAQVVCNSTQDLKEELNFIKSVLKENAYPNQFVERTVNEIENSNTPNNQTTQQTEVRHPHTTNIIPYVPGLSEKIKRIGHRYDVKTSFKTTNTLRSILTHTKPKNTDECSKNCVYNIPCSCGKSYIGETSRPLVVRQEEHKSYIRNRKITGSKISEHILTSDGDHMMEWNNTKILLKESNQEKRKLKETACILLSNNCFSTNSIEMDRTWLPLLREEMRNNRMVID